MTNKEHIYKKKNKIGRWLFSILSVVLIVICVLFFRSMLETNDLIEEENKENPSQEELQALRIAEEIEILIERMTLEEKIAQLFIITPEALTDGLDTIEAGEATNEALKQFPVGGLIYFARNLIEPEQTRRMINMTKVYVNETNHIPLFFSVDEEGGLVSRIANNQNFGVTRFKNLNQMETAQEAYLLGNTIGAYLNDLGLNLNYAPLADVYTNPANRAVRERAFSADPLLVADMVVEEMKGLMEHNIITSLKHFPGHGNTTNDTHFGLAMTKKTLEELEITELIPFRKGIEEGTGMVMMAHISVPNIIGENTPASLSNFMINEVLRQQLGFKGVVITDALNMGAISQNYSNEKAVILAINAGVDVLLMPRDFKEAFYGILNAVVIGEISESRIDDSLRRILQLKKSLE
jgi:beta-N-acetylhexosaminidase